MTAGSDVLRLPAETLYEKELSALIKSDSHPKPNGWKLSPKAVVKYILGGDAEKTKITPKYVGSSRLVEIAVATLATDRALLLVGEPGTAKSWLSEHLCAAITGDSRLVVQGTAGTSEEQIRYSWNYAMLLAEGPSEKALVRSPVMRAMESGKIARLEELTRCPSEVQDALITMLSEKVIAVPELGKHIDAKRGFNLIATANTRDRGVNDMSSALKRRFNLVVLPVAEDVDTEVKIVEKRAKELGTQLQLPGTLPPTAALRRVVQIFHELRKGQTLDGTQKVASPSAVLSTAEAISVIGQSMALAGHFGDGSVTDRDLAAAIVGAIVREDQRDSLAFVEYLENVIRPRGGDWNGIYQALKELV